MLVKIIILMDICGDPVCLFAYKMTYLISLMLMYVRHKTLMCVPTVCLPNKGKQCVRYYLLLTMQLIVS